MAAQLTFNQLVAGSNPAGLNIIFLYEPILTRAVENLILNRVN